MRGGFDEEEEEEEEVVEEEDFIFNPLNALGVRARATDGLQHPDRVLVDLEILSGDLCATAPSFHCIVYWLNAVAVHILLQKAF